MGKVKLRAPRQGEYIPEKSGGYVKLDKNTIYQAWTPEGMEDNEYDTVICIGNNIYVVNGIDLEWIYHKPPECAECGEPLHEIVFIEDTKWKFDADHDGYRELPAKAEAYSLCMNCGLPVEGHIFPEGPINYKAD